MRDRLSCTVGSGGAEERRTSSSRQKQVKFRSRKVGAYMDRMVGIILLSEHNDNVQVLELFE